MKKILLSCVTCLLALGLVTACDNEEEDVTPEDPNAGVVEPGGDEGGGSAKEIVFGFEVEGVMNYIDGGTVSGYAYEGTLTTDLAKAVRITLEESETEGAYYVSFDNGGTTNWITIVDNNGHTNFGYVTTKSLLYYNAEYGCWGDETLNYFLCCNTTYGCFYCSALSEYGPDSTKPSPIATLYYTDGSVVSGLKGYTYNAPAPTEIAISGLSYVLVGGTTQLTASVNAGANSSVVWSIAGPEGVATAAATISETGLVTGVSAAEGLVVTATSAVDSTVSNDFTINVIEVALPVTTGDDEADTTYKLGALDTNDYVYRWFTGETTGSTYLLAGDSYDTAADIYMTEQTIPGISSAYTLSLVKDGESLVYISNNGSSTSVTLSSSPCIWVWNAELAVYAQGTESGRSLVLYTSRVKDEETQVETVTYSFRAYTQTDTNLAYPHAALYETEAKVADISTITVSAEDEATSVEVGKTLQLTATVSPEDADPRVTWSVAEDYEEYATVDENGLVTGVAVCESVTITATSVSDSTKSGQITIAVTEVEPLPEGMIGYFDFSSYDGTAGASLSSDDALDEFWVSDKEGVYLGARQHESVYLGNNSGGALGQTKECLKFGVSGTGGLLQLKFALGTDIDEVVITAHSWYAISEQYPEQTPETLTVNGATQDCSVSGTPIDLTYTISDDLTYLLTLESSERIFITSIVIYGTTGNSYDPITNLTISAGTSESLNVGESLVVSVSYTPDTTVFDIDALVWESTNEEAATVERTINGATIHAVGSGTAGITAKFESVTSNSLSIVVEDKLQEEETILVSSLSGDNKNYETISFSGHQVSVVVDQNKNDGGNSSSAPYYGTSEIRLYYNQTITFTPTYEEQGATISKIVITYNTYTSSSSTVQGHGGAEATLTNSSGESAGTISINETDKTVTLTPSGTGAVIYKNVKDDSNTQLRFSQITIYYSLSAN